MRITLLPAADRVMLPWRNGGGVTRDVAIAPAGAGMTDFLWRVSIAEVANAGSFSIFPDMDRILAILDGTLDLRIAGRATRLSPASDPFPFPGDVPVDGAPVSGAVIDLNVMVRRGEVNATVRRITGNVRLAGDVALIVVTDWGVIDGDIRLACHDAVLLDEFADESLVVEGEALLIELWLYRAKSFAS